MPGNRRRNLKLTHMTDQSLVDHFIATPGAILQHANKREYLKNELGGCAIFAIDHRNEMAITSMTFEKAMDMMALNKYVLPYNCNVDDPVAAIAHEIKDGTDSNCDYIAERGLMEYLTI